jgi:CheY-like chemotaxis protein
MLPQLRACGYECVYAVVSGSQTLAAERADLLLACSELPGGAGGKEFRRIMKTAAGLPVVVVAHVRSLSDALSYFRAGVADYLPAPLSDTELGERIDSALAHPLDTWCEPFDAEACEDSNGDEDANPAAALPVEQDTEDDTDSLSPQELADDSGAPAEAPATSGNPAANDSNVKNHDTYAESAYAGLPVGVLKFSGDGELLLANPAALRILGRDAASIRGAFAPGIAAAGELELIDLNGHAVRSDLWPPALCLKEKAARGRTLGLTRPDRLRVRLRIDATPTLNNGLVKEITVTVCNVTE